MRLTTRDIWFILGLFLITSMVMVISFARPKDETKHTERISTAKTSITTPPVTGEENIVAESIGQAEQYDHDVQVYTFVAHANAVAAFIAALPPPPPPPPPVQAYSPTPTHGGHSDAWWHGISICEQGGRNDPYFGYFSFMDGSQGGKSWDEQVAAGNALLASVGQESPTWAPACIAAAYAASPGG
jgi:hypothetical protein